MVLNAAGDGLLGYRAFKVEENCRFAHLHKTLTMIISTILFKTSKLREPQTPGF